MHFAELLRAGKLPIKTVGDPTIQGANVAGIQGAGFGTPGTGSAVAAITAGLSGALQSPNYKIFFNGI